MEVLTNLLPVFFAIGYILIALEHPVRLNKAAPALLTGFFIWAILFLILGQHDATDHLSHHVGEVAPILIFLMSAMTIVEVIDQHDGFQIITRRISTVNRVKLYWALAFLTFFLSAALDNMTTAIVMSALLRKMVRDKEDLWKFAGLVIIAANAGGAWSPIGDVTTIMLWIGGQVTTTKIMSALFLPSVMCLVVPLAILSFTTRGNITRLSRGTAEKGSFENGSLAKGSDALSGSEKILVFWTGLLALLLVPVLKTATGVPPYIGIIGGLGVLWVVTEFIHRRHPLYKEQERERLTVSSTIRRIDTPSILFFLGILLAVAGLQTGGHLTSLATFLDSSVGNLYAINGIIGMLSAIVDNVPLVAAAMGMYPLDVYPPDHTFWELLAFCAGTGGSILIIGSAAGVAAMGILNIPFGWYVKRMSLLALSGYVAGILTFWLLN